MSIIKEHKNDAVIRHEGMKLLIDNLGMVNAERFIAQMIKEPFDYTEWQKNLFNEMSVQELSDAAMAHITK